MESESFDPFQYFCPDEARLHPIGAVRMAYRTLQLAMEQYCPVSRERSVAMTELETSAMWAIKSIVIQDFKPKQA